MNLSKVSDIRLFLLLLAGLFAVTSSAQAQINYHPLKAEAPIPDDFRTLTSEKYERDRAKINKKEKRKKRKVEEAFYLKSNFMIDELLLSGNVLFNDTLTNYLNAVADRVLKDDPDLRKELRFYTVRSGSANAFATDNGSIFFNIGMFAKLETEAQLAYIMCHEIVHYLEKHSRNQALVVDSLNREGLSRQGKIEETLLAKSNYNKEQESEADLKGLDMFLKTGYARNGAYEALLLLKSSDAPGDGDWSRPEDIPIQIPGVEWPDELLLDTVMTVDPEEQDEWERYSTHPTIDSRIEAIATKMAGEDPNKGKPFQVSAATFERCREIAQLESCHIFLYNRQYIKALYLAQQLEQTRPGDPYLQWVKDRAIYGLAIYSMHRDKKDILWDVEYYHPNLQRLAYFFRKMESRELGMIALYEFWKGAQQHPDRESYKMMRDDLHKTFIKEYDQRGHYLAGDIRLPERDTAWAAMLQRTIVIWDELKKDEGYEKYYSKLQKEVSRQENNYLAKPENDHAPYQARNEMVFVDPVYLKLDERKEQPVSFLASESSQLELTDYLRVCLDRLHIKSRILSPFELQKKDIATYRELSMLKRYAGDITQQEFYIVPVDYEAMAQYVQDGGSRYLALTGVYGLRIDKRAYSEYLLGASLLIPFMLPFTLPEIISPGYEAATVTYVHDIIENKPDKCLCTLYG